MSQYAEYAADQANNEIQALRNEVKDLKQMIYRLSNSLYQLSQNHGDHVCFSTEIVEELDEIRQTAN